MVSMENGKIWTEDPQTSVRFCPSWFMNTLTGMTPDQVAGWLRHHPAFLSFAPWAVLHQNQEAAPYRKPLYRQLPEPQIDTTVQCYRCGLWMANLNEHDLHVRHYSTSVKDTATLVAISSGK